METNFSFNQPSSIDYSLDFPSLDNLKISSDEEDMNQGEGRPPIPSIIRKDLNQGEGKPPIPSIIRKDLNQGDGRPPIPSIIRKDLNQGEGRLPIPSIINQNMNQGEGRLPIPSIINQNMNQGEGRPPIPSIINQNMNQGEGIVRNKNNNRRNNNQAMKNNGNMNKGKRQNKPVKVDPAVKEILNTPQLIPETWKTISFTISPENIVFIENSQSIYSFFYNKAPFEVMGVKFNSVDDAYQLNKLNDLCGEQFAQQYCEKKTLRDKKAFVRETMKFVGISKEDVINWKSETGFNTIFNAIVEKFYQNKELLEEMKKDKDKLIVNTYGNDPIDACGDRSALELWINCNTGNDYVMPSEVNPDNLLHFPTTGGGKNVQGIMVMLARHAISSQENW